MKALEAKWGRAAALAAVGSFLAVDLILFGNCIMPTQDATPVPVKEGRWQAGATGTAAILVPVHGALELRQGTSGISDIGYHAAFELLPEEGGFYSEGYSDSPGGFHGGPALSLGVDRKSALSVNGNFHTTLQYGVAGHYVLGTEGPAPAATVLGGILVGTEWGYFSPRLHVGYQTSPFFQAEIPMGLQLNAFRDRLGVELGVNPSIMLVDGGRTIPWPWQYVSLRWRFGG
jgi:hypothetical protein